MYRGIIFYFELYNMFKCLQEFCLSISLILVKNIRLTPNNVILIVRLNSKMHSKIIRFLSGIFDNPFLRRHLPPYILVLPFCMWNDSFYRQMFPTFTTQRPGNRSPKNRTVDFKAVLSPPYRNRKKNATQRIPEIPVSGDESTRIPKISSCLMI